MHRKAMLIWIVSCLLMIAAFASAEEAGPALRLTEQRHEESYVQIPAVVGLDDPEIQAQINQDMSQALALDQALVKLGQLRAGGAAGQMLTVDCEGNFYGNLLSLTVTMRGSLPEGRDGEQVLGLNYRLDTGERLTLSDVFLDEDAAVAAMEAIALSDVEQNGNAYSEVNEITPMPRDRFALEPWGIALYYPDTQLAYFSGRAGGYAFFWYELDNHWQDALRGELNAFAQTPENSLPGLSCALEEDVSEVILRSGLLKEPDYTLDHAVYTFESADLRGISLLTDRNAPEGEGAVVGSRAARMDYQGLRTGTAAPSDCEGLLGAPNRVETIDADAAYEQLLPEGEIWWYQSGANELGFHFAQGVLDVVMLRTQP